MDKVASSISTLFFKPRNLRRKRTPLPEKFQLISSVKMLSDNLDPLPITVAVSVGYSTASRIGRQMDPHKLGAGEGQIPR